MLIPTSPREIVMIKELVLVPRVLYGVFFTLVGLYATFTSPMYPRSFIGAFLFLFLSSFVWQYFVLHFTLKNMNKKNSERLLFLHGSLYRSS